MTHLIHFRINTIATSDILTHRLRLYRQFGLRAADSSYLSSHCLFPHPELSNIHLGERSFLNHGCFIENGDAIHIGSNVCLGPRVTILTTTHIMGSSDRRVGNGCKRKPVHSGDGCWICAGATIPGVTIREGCTIAGGARSKTTANQMGFMQGYQIVG